MAGGNERAGTTLTDHEGAENGVDWQTFEAQFTEGEGSAVACFNETPAADVAALAGGVVTAEVVNRVRRAETIKRLHPHGESD